MFNICMFIYMYVNIYYLFTYIYTCVYIYIYIFNLHAQLHRMRRHQSGRARRECTSFRLALATRFANSLVAKEFPRVLPTPGVPAFLLS